MARRLILQPVDEPQSQQTDLPVSESLVDNSSGIVWEVQAKLRKLGFYDGDMDGELSDETVTAIRTYKLDRKLPGDTLLDDNTLAALGFYGD